MEKPSNPFIFVVGKRATGCPDGVDAEDAEILPDHYMVPNEEKLELDAGWFVGPAKSDSSSLTLFTR
jgi:hypothetical protein